AFQFDAQLLNQSGQTQTFNAWIRWRYPNGTWSGVLLGPLTLSLPNGSNVVRQRNQNVAGSNPSGVYTYVGYTGTYSATNPTVWDSSSFLFTKTATDGGEAWVQDNANGGEPFPGEGSQIPLLPSGLTLKASPNPFNPRTALGFTLAAPGHVLLKVYDTAGREVGTLVDGWREAGLHEATFDASGLPSGVYLARMEAGGSTQTQKLLLLK
ncbi:MAG: T9SS C-terminal target domain-containing protein, partial [Candidatus Zixiibacteriota bacterium]